MRQKKKSIFKVIICQCVYVCDGNLPLDVSAHCNGSVLPLTVSSPHIHKYTHKLPRLSLRFPP